MLTSNSVLWATEQAFLKNLQELDLEAIAYQLMQLGWSHQQTSRAIQRYRMFLFLVYLHPNTRLIPTQEVDRVWHCHILHTRKYRQDCQMLFGRFIDHEPDSQRVHPIGLNSSFVVRTSCSSVEVREQDAHTTIAKLSDRKQISFPHHRSACGRPGFVECDRSSVAFV